QRRLSRLPPPRRVAVPARPGRPPPPHRRGSPARERTSPRCAARRAAPSPPGGGAPPGRRRIGELCGVASLGSLPSGPPRVVEGPEPEGVPPHVHQRRVEPCPEALHVQGQDGQGGSQLECPLAG